MQNGKIQCDMQSDVGKLEAMQEINDHNDLCSRSVLYVCGTNNIFQTGRVEHSPEIMRLCPTRYRRDHLL